MLPLAACVLDQVRQSRNYGTEEVRERPQAARPTAPPCTAGTQLHCSLNTVLQGSRARAAGVKVSLLSVKLDPPQKTITQGKKKALLFPPRD